MRRRGGARPAAPAALNTAEPATAILIRTVLRPPDWTIDAACANQPAEWWHSEDTREQLAARTICTTCPVRLTCALDALGRAEPYGVWGGLDRADRRTVAREYGYPHPAAAAHGTRSRYVAGCRCPDCTRAHAAYEHKLRHRRTRPRAAEDFYEPAPGPAPARPASADARFLADVEAAELGIEATYRSDGTAIELGRLICRADTAGMSEAGCVGCSPAPDWPCARRQPS